MFRAFAIFSLTICLLLGLSSPQSLAFGSFDGGGPSVFGTNKLFIFPGETVTFTVQLDGPATGEKELIINCAPGAFLDLPTTITPQAGATSVTFSGTAGLSATSGVVVTVSDGIVTIPAPLLMFFTATAFEL